LKARGLLANESCPAKGNPELILNWRALFTHPTRLSFPKSRFPQINNCKRPRLISGRSFGRPQVEAPTAVRLPGNGVRGDQSASGNRQIDISSNGASGESGRIYMIGCVNQSVSHTSLKQWPSYSVSHQHRRGCLEEGVRKETLTPFTFLVDAFISSFASRRRRLFTLIPEHAYHHPSLPQYPHSSGSPGWTSCLLTQTTG
jgi:hypothetical protein